MNNKILITSSGIIRNREVPRVGVISHNSVNSDFLDEILSNGINLSYESYLEGVKLECQRLGIDEEGIEKRLDNAGQEYESDGDTYLFGDWTKDKDGNYVVDKMGKDGFAVEYSTNSGNLCVEWSKETKLCHHTSPCYQMGDGSGPCGDLDTEGDSVIAYTLPSDCLRGEE